VISIPLSDVLTVATILFAVGLGGVLARRNLVFVLLSLEIMLNAAGLAFVGAGAHHGDASGQAMFVFILAVAAAEVSIGLALVLQIHRRIHTVDADSVDRLRG
jgi:NADH-quinone oxidoreductase subunit K